MEKMISSPGPCRNVEIGEEESGYPHARLKCNGERAKAANPVLARPQRQAYAEFHRLRGELILIKDSSKEHQAERSFREAIAIAREQAARLYELRAATSLARLLNKQGRDDEARANLADIYGWFTEGFGTTDLKDAKSLLDELGGTGE